jgi:hypothetical protein
MLHPASTRPSGGYRLAPLVLPPLPPTTGVGNTGTGTGRGESAWTATREPTSQPLPGAAPDIPWVEPPLPADDPPLPADDPPLPAPAPGVVSAAPDPAPAEGRTSPAATPAADVRPTPPGPQVAPAGKARGTPAGPAPAPVSTPTQFPSARPVLAHRASTTRAEPAPGPSPIAEGTPVLAAAPAVRLPPPEARPHTEPTVPAPAASSGPVLARPVEPAPRAPRGSGPGPTTGHPTAGPAATDVGERPRTTPPAAPTPVLAPEPVEIVVEGIDPLHTSDAPTVQASEETPVEPPDDAVVPVPGPPLPPGGRGPRRERARLSFAIAGRVQTELQRMYLDRTLRRFR